MSAIVRTPECFPENDRFLNAFRLGDDPVTPVARHEQCSGGFTMPGVLGGWVCPCECHRSLGRPLGEVRAVQAPPTSEARL